MKEVDNETARQLREWCEWLRVIRSEIYDLVTSKHIFWSVQDLIRRNPKLQQVSTFYRYFGVTYATHVALGIRRQIDNDQRTLSFSRLLESIAANPECLSREYYEGHYTGSIRAHLADADFDRICGDGAPHLPREIVERDVTDLRKAAEATKGYVDMRIAHRDRSDPDRIPTFNDLDECIELLDQLYVKYAQLFSGSAPPTLLPTYQYDWKAIFDVAWRLPKGGAE